MSIPYSLCMCGRYYRRSDKQRLAEHFAAKPTPGLTDLVPDYNVAPTTFQPVIRKSRDGAVRELLTMRWGLVPFSAKSLTDFKGFSTFNAKAETVATRPTWREPFERGPRRRDESTEEKKTHHALLRAVLHGHGTQSAVVYGFKTTS